MASTPKCDLPTRLEAALLCGPYVLIDARNRGVGVMPTLEAAEAAIARGELGATTYAGQVRPHVVAIDIDATDARLGDHLVEELTGWCQRRDLWTISRESGGGAGRKHVFVLPERSSAELLDLVELLRRERRLTGRQLDVRSTIRPLTAPHRVSGLRRPPAVELVDVARAEAAAARHTNDPRPQRRLDTSVSKQRGAEQGSITARGARALAQLSAEDDRSAREFALTRQLATAGERISDTWAAVASLDGHAAERGFGWWQRCMWSRVRPADSGELHHTDLARLILPTVAANRHRWADLATRRRHSLETVLWAVLERVDEHAEAWQPLSQRDVRLATGLDRRTIKASLDTLIALGVLRRRQLPQLDAADEWILGPLSETSLDAPPVLTPPAPAWLPEAPAGSASAALDRHFDAPSPTPTTGSTRQRQLAHHRQAACRQATAQSNPTPRLCARRAQLLEEVTAERDAFYPQLRTARDTRRTIWEDQRRAAYVANQQRHRRWWHSLTEHERTERRDDCRQRWHQQSAAERSTWRSRRQHQSHILDGTAQLDADPIGPADLSYLSTGAVSGSQDVRRHGARVDRRTSVAGLATSGRSGSRRPFAGVDFAHPSTAAEEVASDAWSDAVDAAG